VFSRASVQEWNVGVSSVAGSLTLATSNDFHTYIAQRVVYVGHVLR
jgi:hypothetical protein